MHAGHIAIEAAVPQSADMEDGPSETARRVAAHRLGFTRVPAAYGDPAADDALTADVAAGCEVPADRMHDYLAARTAFFDRVVVGALGRGVRQVVVGAAGYDGRAFRYAKPGVRWFEIDHPATQRDKLARLSRLGIDASGVGFVAADFRTGPVAEPLTAAGFDPGRLTDGQRDGLIRALGDGPAAAQAGFAATAQNRNGWTWVTGVDNFGFDYPKRAVVAGPYLGGQGEREAIYPGSFVDSDGQPLSGQNRYQIHFDSPPPVDAFWSLTVYDSATKMFTPNSIHRYKLGTDTPGLGTNSDGSLDILLSHQQPSAAERANWLPTPAGGFYIILRLYQPADAVLDGTYQLPPMHRIG